MNYLQKLAELKTDICDLYITYSPNKNFSIDNQEQFGLTQEQKDLILRFLITLKKTKGYFHFTERTKTYYVLINSNKFNAISFCFHTKALDGWDGVFRGNQI